MTFHTWQEAELQFFQELLLGPFHYNTNQCSNSSDFKFLSYYNIAIRHQEAGTKVLPSWHVKNKLQELPQHGCKNTMSILLGKRTHFSVLLEYEEALMRKHEDTVQ